MIEHIRRFFTSRYVLMLEDEVDRLREENRGLLNSLLTRAGVQPIDPRKPIPRIGSNASRHQRQAQLERDFLKHVTGVQPERFGNAPTGQPQKGN